MKPISFVIITYNRPADLLALVQNIATLHRAEELLEDIIIVNNDSDVSYAETQAFIKAHPELPFRFLESAENLGVARGRNFAVSKSNGTYLIMLDDDAEMGNLDCLEILLDEFQRPSGDRETAILSFRVEYFESRQLQANAFPHKDLEGHKDLERFDTYYFAGGAHAIRRDVYNRLGGYPVDFFYGMEEYDLSYRLIEAGHSIRYTNRILMLHKESPLGRATKKEKQAMLWINKSKVAWRYLPKPYFITTALLWSVEYLRKTNVDIIGWLRNWPSVFRISRVEKRTPIGAAALAYLRQVRARLWY